MITGNGRQGALCYGGPEAIQITLSHERLFLPAYEPLPPPPTVRILPELRSLLLTGRYRTAAERVHAFAATEHPGFAATRPTDPFIGAATLTYVPDGPVIAHDYRRTVDIATGVVTQRWMGAAGEVVVEVFASRPADAIVVRVSGATAGVLR